MILQDLVVLHSVAIIGCLELNYKFIMMFHTVYLSLYMLSDNISLSPGPTWYPCTKKQLSAISELYNV